MRRIGSMIVFHGGIFSNWAQTPFRGPAAWDELLPELDALGIPHPAPGTEISNRLRGRTYTCGEQWMMAAKAWLFGDLEALKRIQDAKTPAEQKKIGRDVRPFNPRVWDAACMCIVTAGLVAKFTSSERMTQEILDTRGLELVEGSKWDRIWGVGIDWRDDAIADRRNWRGDNRLGRCLARARDIIAMRIDDE